MTQINYVITNTVVFIRPPTGNLFGPSRPRPFQNSCEDELDLEVQEDLGLPRNSPTLDARPNQVNYRTIVMNEDHDTNLFIGPQNLFEWRAVIRSGKFKASNFDSSTSGINTENIMLDDNCTQVECF